MCELEPAGSVLLWNFTGLSLSFPCLTSFQYHVLCVNWHGLPTIKYQNCSSLVEQRMVTSRSLQGASGVCFLMDFNGCESQRLVLQFHYRPFAAVLRNGIHEKQMHLYIIHKLHTRLPPQESCPAWAWSRELSLTKQTRVCQLCLSAVWFG